MRTSMRYQGEASKEGRKLGECGSMEEGRTHCVQRY